MPQISLARSQRDSETKPSLRVLLIPDSIHWITGSIAQSIVRHNSWIDGTIISGPVLSALALDDASLFDSYDVVHFLCPYASRDWLPRLRARVACVTSHHHVSDDWALLEHNLNGDAIIVGSQQWADDVIARGAAPERVICVPYGVETSHYLPSASSRIAERKRLGLSNTDTVVGLFAKRSSNENDRKGTDTFVDAVRILAGDLPSFAVLIVGPGWHELVQELRSLGIKCKWLQFVGRSSEMARIYQALDFYWVTSRVEGGPVTLLEAMSTGICCVTTPVGLALEVVRDGINAALVPFNDAAAVSRRTLALSRDRIGRSRMGDAARATMVRDMDSSVTTTRVREAYDIALAHFAEKTRADARPATQPAGKPVSPLLMRQAAVLEQLAWAEALLIQKQRWIGLRIICTTWIANPRSAMPPRYLLRNVLPSPLVSAIIGFTKARAWNR